MMMMRRRRRMVVVVVVVMMMMMMMMWVLFVQVCTGILEAGGVPTLSSATTTLFLAGGHAASRSDARTSAIAAGGELEASRSCERLYMNDENICYGNFLKKHRHV